MKEENQPIENPNENLDNTPIENQNEDLDNTSTLSEYSKWIDNQGDDVKNVFGFNSNAELANDYLDSSSKLEDLNLESVTKINSKNQIGVDYIK